MFQTVKQLIDRLSSELAQPADTPPKDHSLQLATAVLLVEVMRAAPEVHEDEYAAVLHALRRKFELSEDELQQLLALAHERSRTAYDYQHFTQQLNQRFTHAQKVAMVEAMWAVAFADRHLDAHENTACCTSRTASTSPPNCTPSTPGLAANTNSCPEYRRPHRYTFFAPKPRALYPADTSPDQDQGSPTPSPLRRRP